MANDEIKSVTDYAKIVVDPCNGPLSPPPYGGSAGDGVSRFVTSIPGPAVAGSTWAVLAFHPVFGIFSLLEPVGGLQAGTSSFFYPASQGASFVAPGAPSTCFTQSNPGMGFVGNNVRSARGVAACIELFSSLPALSTGGRVWSGMIPGSTLRFYLTAGSVGGTGAATSPAVFVQHLTEGCPLPVGQKCTLNWVPSTADEKYNIPYNLQGLSLTDSSNSLPMDGVNFACFAVNSASNAINNINFKVTSVLEYQFNVASQMPSNPSELSPTGYTKVIRMLQAKDPSWYIDTGKKVGMLLGKAGGVAARVGWKSAGSALLTGLGALLL